MQALVMQIDIFRLYLTALLSCPLRFYGLQCLLELNWNYIQSNYHRYSNGLVWLLLRSSFILPLTYNFIMISKPLFQKEILKRCKSKPIKHINFKNPLQTLEFTQKLI